MSKSEKDNNDDDHQHENNQDDNKYYNKVRASMKKDPASVQYWIDTGEPPHKLDDIQQPDSASSISEDDDDDDNLNFDKLSQKHDNNNKARGASLVDSSVDTAAYILSNKNITKKAEAIAIIEDSKTPKKIENSNTNNEVKLSIESSILCNGNEEKVDGQYDTDKSLDKSTNKTKEIHQSPLKISDAVMHLDKILNSTKKSTSQDDDITEESVKFKNNNETSNKTIKSYHRRKLYTGRSSPVDICLSSVERRPRSSAITTNEAFVNETPLAGIKKRKRFRKTIRITKKRRSSRLANINDHCSTEKNDFIKRLESSSMDDKKKLILDYQKEAKLQNEKLQIHNSQVKIFNAKSNNQSKDDDKLKNMKDICLKKQPVVRLIKLPDKLSSLTTKTTIESDNRLIDSQRNKKPKLPIKPLLPDHPKIVDKKISYKTSNKSNKYEDSKNKHMKRKRRNFKAKNVEIKKYNSDDVLADIKNLFDGVTKNNNLTFNNMKTNLNNTKSLYSFCICGSSDDESEIIPPITRRTIFNKKTISFSSDEEDDFDKLLKQNKKKRRKIS